jgi:3-hydroxyisobutyrate dehydrogenase-like beta-hydroxyacid dehydrogenase
MALKGLRFGRVCGPVAWIVENGKNSRREGAFDMRNIGVIGVGSMGRPMALNLIKAGYTVSVCDMRDEALAPFRADGVPTSARAAELVGNDLIIVMVGNDSDVADVTVGPGGLSDVVDPARPPLVAIMSSVLPRTIRDAAAALGKKNAVVVDAPVSGGPVRAAAAAISIMAAGSDADFARLEPVFAALGRPVFRCGPVGAAAGVKIVNNILGVANMLLMNEAAHLAATLGIDLPFLTGVMEVSSGRNYATQDFAAYRSLLFANSDDSDVTRRLLAILRKDLKLATTLSKDSGVGTPILNAVSKATDALDAGDLSTRWQMLGQAMPR